MVKRFKAPTVERALAFARAELGESCVVLWSKPRRTWLGAEEWEVMAASTAAGDSPIPAATPEDPTGLAGGVPPFSFAEMARRDAWAAVGISGAGRTSVLVKLALRLKGIGRSVRLVAADRRKLTAGAELAAYADAIDAGFALASDSPGVGEGIQLIDAPALLPGESDQGVVARACIGASVLLVLDVTQRAAEMRRIVEMAGSLKPAAVAFTRVDAAWDDLAVADAARIVGLPVLGTSRSPSYGVPFRFVEDPRGAAVSLTTSVTSDPTNPFQREKTCQA